MRKWVHATSECGSGKDVSAGRPEGAVEADVVAVDVFGKVHSTVVWRHEGSGVEEDDAHGPGQRDVARDRSAGTR